MDYGRVTLQMEILTRCESTNKKVGDFSFIFIWMPRMGVADIKELHLCIAA